VNLVLTQKILARVPSLNDHANALLQVQITSTSSNNRPFYARDLFVSKNAFLRFLYPSITLFRGIATRLFTVSDEASESCSVSVVHESEEESDALVFCPLCGQAIPLS
jgi:hypothetical protein